MNKERNKVLIVNYIFILGILILFLNDHIFKFKYHNFITGKLSDVFGVLIFPLLLTYIFPKLKEYSIIIAAAIFSFWKSEYSQSLLDFYNKISPIQTSRIVDYSDLLVLLLLPIPYYLIRNEKMLHKFRIEKLNSKLILFPTLLILFSESPPPSFYYTMNEGNLKCHNCKMTIHKDKMFVLQQLKLNGIEFDTVMPIKYGREIDTVSGGKKYLKKLLILDNDTLKNVSFTIFPINENKTKIYFTGLDVSNKLLQDPKLDYKLRKHYKKLIFKRIKENFKN